MKTSIIIIGVIIVALLSFSSYLIPSFGEYSSPGDTQVSSTFEFSVNEDEIIKQMNDAVGQRVKLFYKENLHTNKFDGTTDYFIYKIEVIK